MAVRTTATAVGGICPVETGADLDPFIETANNLVTKCCVPSDAADTDYTAEDLELIERWLSAHFYKIFEPVVGSEKAGPVGASFKIEVDEGLAATPWGQQAMVIDTEGGLARYNDATQSGGVKTATAVWLGTDPDA